MDVFYTVVIIVFALFIAYFFLANRNTSGNSYSGGKKFGAAIGSAVGGFFKKLFGKLKEKMWDRKRSTAPGGCSSASGVGDNSDDILQNNETEVPTTGNNINNESSLSGADDILADDEDDVDPVSCNDPDFAAASGENKGNNPSNQSSTTNDNLIKIMVLSQEDARVGRSSEYKFNKDQFPVTIGHGKRCKAFVNDGKVSKIALQIHLENGILLVENTGGSDALMNGERLKIGEKQQICATTNRIYIGNTNIIIDVYSSDLLEGLRYITFERGLYNKETGTTTKVAEFTVTQKITSADLGISSSGAAIIIGYIATIGSSLSFSLATSEITSDGKKIPLRLRDSDRNLSSLISPLCEGTVFYIRSCQLKVKSIKDGSIGRAPTEN